MLIISIPVPLQETNTLMDGPNTQPTNTDDTAESIGLRVVEQIADEIDADPMALDPLYDTIDADALERLFPGSGEGGRGQCGHVVFTHAGCEVTVSANGEIEVTQRASERAKVTEPLGE